MKNSRLKTSLLILLVLVYNYCFWQEKFGLNLSLFSLLLIGSNLFIYPKTLKSKVFWIYLFFAFISSAMVVINNSFISFFAHIASMFILLAYIHDNRLKSILYVLAYGSYSFGTSWLNTLIKPIRIPKQLFLKNSIANKTLSYVKLLFVPLLFVVIFFTIFLFANPVFSEWTQYISEALEYGFLYVFTKVSVAKLAFVYFGIVLCVYALFRWKISCFHTKEQSKSDSIKRIRKQKLYPTSLSLIYPMALKNEYKTATILVFMVNVLLLFVNVIDIEWLWFNFHYKDIENFATMVHQGTYALIFSILLSMAIMLYYFRANLNFYTKNIWLKRLCYIWIFQNIILLISVVLRTYYYIHERGLAYKRIGVLIYLALTLFGLLTLYLKISKQKSMYYLLKKNAWAVCTILVFMATINWDILIVKYNIWHYQQEKVIDMEFLMTRSDKTLRIIDKYKNELPMAEKYYLRSEPYDITYRTYLKKRIESFKRKQKNYTWLSWNYQDSRSLEYFE